MYNIRKYKNNNKPMLDKARFTVFSSAMIVVSCFFVNLAVADTPRDQVVRPSSAVVSPANTVAHQEQEVVGSGYFRTSTISSLAYSSAGNYPVLVDRQCQPGTTLAAAVYVENSGSLTPFVYSFRGHTYSVGNCSAGRICLAASVTQSDSGATLNLYGLASQGDVGTHLANEDPGSELCGFSYNFDPGIEVPATYFDKRQNKLVTANICPILAQNACDWAAEYQTNRTITVGYQLYCKSQNSAAASGPEGAGDVKKPTDVVCTNTNEYEDTYLDPED